jgi:hypothetical protein
MTSLRSRVYGVGFSVNRHGLTAENSMSRSMEGSGHPSSAMHQRAILAFGPLLSACSAHTASQNTRPRRTAEWRSKAGCITQQPGRATASDAKHKFRESRAQYGLPLLISERTLAWKGPQVSAHFPAPASLLELKSRRAVQPPTAVGPPNFEPEGFRV